VRFPGGGSKWFGRDPEEAARRYVLWIVAMGGFAEGFHRLLETMPRNNLDVQLRSAIARLEQAAPPRPMTVGDIRSRRPSAERAHAPQAAGAAPKKLRLNDLAGRLCKTKDGELTERSLDDWWERLRPFLEFVPSRGGPSLGELPYEELIPDDLIDFRASLLERMKPGGPHRRLSPSTVNTRLTYARALLKFGEELGLTQRVLPLGLLKKVRPAPITRKTISVPNVRRLLAAVADVHPTLAKAMLLQFLGTMRPSELPRIAHGNYEVRGRGILAIYSKTTNKSGELRPVLLCDEGLALLQSLNPTYTDASGATKRLFPNENAYRHLCWRVGRKIEKKSPGLIRELTGKKDLSPHALRHAANQALIDAGVREEYIRAAMGRCKPRVDRAYGSENYAAAREAVAVLAELIPPASIFGAKPIAASPIESLAAQGAQHGKSERHGAAEGGAAA
jgi:integrase